MMKRIGILVLAVMLSACSTFGGKKDERNVKSEFFGGDIKVTYTFLVILNPSLHLALVR